MYGVVSLAVLLLALGCTQAKGWEEMSVADTKVIEIADWAAEAMGYTSCKILKAEKQVVDDGVDYKLELQFPGEFLMQKTCTLTVQENLDGNKRIKEPKICSL